MKTATKTLTLTKDPLHIILIGVAGQGNVVISTLISNALVKEGYKVSFSQSYGSTQRGGPVTNWVTVSKNIQSSPLILSGHADIILSLEPVEALRMLRQYGNPDVITIVNPRPLRSIDIARSKTSYPDLDKLLEAIKTVSGKTLIINATEEAQKLGDSRVANIVLLGTLIGSGALPLDKESLEPIIRERFPKAFEINMKALSRGMELAKA